MKDRRAGLAARARFQQTPAATTLFVVLLLIFLGFSTFFALQLRREIIPDEAVHISLSSIYAGTWGLPADQPSTYRYGLITHSPFLYYWINGRLINVLQGIFGDPGSWKILTTLRLFSAACSALAVVYTWLLAREVVRGRWWQILPVFLLTNTLMFMFLSGGVNYDNLANLCCFAGLYHLVRIFTGRAFASNSLAWLIWMLLGTLTKITVLPLLAVTGLAWLVFILRRSKEIQIGHLLHWKFLSLLALFLGLALLNLSLYGTNLLQYRAVVPSCERVLTREQCMKNPVFRRDAESVQTQPAPMRLANMFDGSAPSPTRWFWDFWSYEMLGMTYGIMGHLTYRPAEWLIQAYRLWFIGLLLIALLWWKKPRFSVGALAAIAGLYGLVVLQTNLSSELRTGFHHLGIQGRYLFPVLGATYVLIAALLSRVPSRAVAYSIVALTMVLFLWCSPAKTLFTPIDIVQNPSIPAEQKAAVDSEEISQDFISLCNGPMTRVSLFVSTNETAARTPIVLRLIDLKSGAVLTDEIKSAIPAAGSAWLDFSLPELPDSTNRAYRLVFKAAQSEEVPLSAWQSKSNVYRGGDAYIHGVPTNSDLVFRYHCHQTALAGWFY